MCCGKPSLEEKRTRTNLYPHKSLASSNQGFILLDSTKEWCKFLFVHSEFFKFKVPFCVCSSWGKKDHYRVSLASSPSKNKGNDQNEKLVFEKAVLLSEKLKTFGLLVISDRCSGIKTIDLLTQSLSKKGTWNGEWEVRPHQAVFTNYN